MLIAHYDKLIKKHFLAKYTVRFHDNQLKIEIFKDVVEYCRFV